jgi:hypothetical protein
MNTKVLQTYRTYPILLVGRAIFLAACVFLIVTMDLDLWDKFLFGGPAAVIIGLVAVFRWSTGLTAVLKKKGKGDIEWRMVFATIGMGASMMGLLEIKNSGFNTVLLIMSSLVAGCILGGTIGELVFLSKTETT